MFEDHNVFVFKMFCKLLQVKAVRCFCPCYTSAEGRSIQDDLLSFCFWKFFIEILIRLCDRLTAVKNIGTAGSDRTDGILAVFHIHSLCICPHNLRTGYRHIRIISVIRMTLQFLCIRTEDQFCRAHAKLFKRTAGMPELCHDCFRTHIHTA